MDSYEIKNVLVTVKAYPNPSKKYKETVCCAGIDLATNKWIRLYPIPYRDLDRNKRFKKYSVIEVKCFKALDDNRPESYKILPNSINIIEWLDSRPNWERRKSIVLPTLSESMCKVLELSEEGSCSLALIKPYNIDFLWIKSPGKGNGTKEKYYSQLGLFDKRKGVIEKIPFSFYYTFNCNNGICEGHKLLIIDWEIKQAFRSWKSKYKTDELLLEKIKEKWLTMMCAEKRDVYFFVGNMQRFKWNFMILGTFYPPREKKT